MFIKQLSIFLENTPGRLAAVTKVLSDNDIDIRALSLSDTSDFGILRLIVADAESACGILKENGCTAGITEVLAVGLTDRPGSMAAVAALLGERGINIEYLYAFVSRQLQKAYVIMRVEDNVAAAEALRAAGFEMAEAEDIYSI